MNHGEDPPRPSDQGLSTALPPKQARCSTPRANSTAALGGHDDLSVPLPRHSVPFHPLESGEETTREKGSQEPRCSTTLMYYRCGVLKGK